MTEVRRQKTEGEYKAIGHSLFVIRNSTIRFYTTLAPSAPDCYRYPFTFNLFPLILSFQPLSQPYF